MPWAKTGVTPYLHFLRVLDEATGNEIKDVVEVDTDVGMVVRACRDTAGRFRLTDGGQELLLETLNNKVLRIEIDEAAWVGRCRVDSNRTPRWVPWNPDAFGLHQPA